MSRLSCCAFVLLIVAGAKLGETMVSAQAPAPEPARIVTVDGVKLNAVFYPSPKKNSPTVIMLHPIGDGKNIKMPGWKSLATTLQTAGYAVMMFDFRGHGDSTTIDDTQVFLNYPANRNNVKLKEKDTIVFKDYKNSTSAYLPVLINDIAAVKAYLDRKNDKEECNTASTIVIGADQGATLGAIWMNSEWSRYKYTPPINMFTKGEFDKRPEGKDIIAAVFLTIQPKLGTRIVSIGSVLKVPCRDQGTAATFFYGKDDGDSKKLAKALEAVLKFPKTSKKHDYIGAVELNTNLSGAKLLQAELEADKAIVDYLDKVVTERGNEWSMKDAQNASFMWRIPGILQPIPAKLAKGEKNLNFSDYYKFIP